MIPNPIISGNLAQSPGDEPLTVTGDEPLTVTIPSSGYEVQTITGTTRDLSKADYFVDSNFSSSMKTVGIMSAIAIALHNIPEGIITYIPEGLSVALPVFYATKNRGKAFVWSLVSGLAEPFGAFLCMLFLQRWVNNYIFGFLFGVTGGIMTHICVYELIPTGIKLSCEKNYTTTAMLCGIAFILISLILICRVCFNQQSTQDLLLQYEEDRCGL